eukprot:GHVT01040188.1.p1 GENE.GHVT01040188.1~~GHVT01040188.1.p1  ORF type:complete len:403 (+),score=23.40 GHVT01040188.1:1180-2388(+)
MFPIVFVLPTLSINSFAARTTTFVLSILLGSVFSAIVVGGGVFAFNRLTSGSTAPVAEIDGHDTLSTASSTAQSKYPNSEKGLGSSAMTANRSTQANPNLYCKAAMLLPDGTTQTQRNVLYMQTTGALPNRTLECGDLPPVDRTGTRTKNKYTSKLPVGPLAVSPLIFSTPRKVWLKEKLDDWEPMCGDGDKWWGPPITGKEKITPIPDNPMFEILTHRENKGFFQTDGRFFIFGENEDDGSVKLADGAISWTQRSGVRQRRGGAASIVLDNDEWNHTNGSRAIGFITEPSGTIFRAGYDAVVMYCDAFLQGIQSALAHGYTITVAGSAQPNSTAAENMINLLGFLPQLGLGTGVFLNQLPREYFILFHRMGIKMESLARQECIARGYVSASLPNTRNQPSG